MRFWVSGDTSFAVGVSGCSSHLWIAQRYVLLLSMLLPPIFLPIIALRECKAQLLALSILKKPDRGYRDRRPECKTAARQLSPPVHSG